MAQVERQYTREDVLRYVKDLQDYAASLTNPAPENPNYRPYVQVWAPTREYGEHLIKKLGPTKAILQLEARADAAVRSITLQQEIDEARLDRERRRRALERRDENEGTMGLSPGARISRSLARLRVVSEGSTANLDSSTSPSAEHPSRHLVDRRDDEYRKARSIALQAARRIEGIVERATRTPLPPAKTGDRNSALRAMRGYSPEQVALMDPAQGLPRQIRERRAEMGLDEQTGDVLDGAA